jgi:hypothetical protein
MPLPAPLPAGKACALRLTSPDKKGKQNMFKKVIRWILPLLVILAIAFCLMLSPIMATHAATPSTSGPSISAPGPDMVWRPH